MPIYLNSEDQHNKFWSYEEQGNNTVLIKWGRVGTDGQNQTKKFGSSSAMHSFINDKIAEKERKGYKASTEENFHNEKQTAQALGVQYKISRMLFVNKSGKTLTQISSYDPQRYVYVEVLNSWKKDITRLLLAKNESLVIGGGVVDGGQEIEFGNSSTPYGQDADFVSAVRDVLKRLSIQVVEIIKTVKFAAVGVRVLFDDDGEASGSADFTAVYAAVNMTGVDKQVVNKFAAMGNRVLDL